MLSRLLLLGVLALAPVVLAGGCFGEQPEQSSATGPNNTGMDPEDDDRGQGAGAVGCQLASDCALAASTCCECPSFAVPMGEGYDAGCEDVECGASGLCPAVEAVCDQGQCLMICSPIITDKICNFGFQRDAAGCLLNECAGAPSSTVSECEIDTDCVQVPADCCGCGLGGFDKAVPLSQADSEADFLNCPVDPACPGIDICNLEEVAQCMAGACTLAAAAGTDPSSEPPPIDEVVLCGTPDLPTCAAGSTCILNDISANAATPLGVGSCVVN